jgi:hypothetical protein
VEATVLTGNTASAALLGRAGFQRQGVLRGRFLKREAFWDVWMFGLTRADWAAPGIQDRQPYRTAGPSTRQPSTRAGLGRLRSWLDRGGVRLSCR